MSLPNPTLRNRIPACLFTVSLWFALLVLPASIAVGSADGELEAFKREVRAKYDLKEAAFAANDPEPILNRFYTADVISTDLEGHTHVGREALRPIYEEVIGSTVRIQSFNSFVNGDAGWDWVNFHVTPPPEAEAEPFTFKMLFLWERINGEWWSHGEMYVMGEFEIK